MRIADCGIVSRRVYWRCIAVILVMACAEMVSLQLDNPQSAIRNPHFHQFHVSVAQLEFDQNKQSVEAVLRVFADDLEAALNQYAKRQIKLDPAKSKEAGEIVMPYLRNHFELKDSTGKSVKFTWVGIEGQVDMFWLYFKGKLPGGLAGAQLKNKVFCDLFVDQVNIVNAKHQGKQIGLMFEPKDDFKNIVGR